MDDRPTPRLDREAANEVIRRAAELDADGRLDTPGIDRRALEEAAGEVGISPAAVRRALAEHDAGALDLPADRSILGPARARVVRSATVPADIARERVDRWLKGQLLQVHARRDAEVEWRRRSDVTARIRRRVDLTKRVQLSGVDAVTASVVPSGDGGSLVRLDADLAFTRRGLLTGAVAAPMVAGPVLGGVAALVLGEPVILLAGLPTGALLGSAGLVVGRRTLASERAEAIRVLELFLDRLDGTR